jgi:hypothetical protein
MMTRMTLMSRPRGPHRPRRYASCIMNALLPLRRRPLLASCLLSLLLPLATPARAQAAPPRQNLLVELRWVESGVSGAALAGSRQGGVVLGTAGSIAAQPGGTTLSTRRVEEGIEQSHQLLVLNGHAASVMLAETELLQWLDYEVEPAQRGAARPRVHAQLRSQPVRVELRALAPAGDRAAAGGETEILSTVQLPLGDWVTVARRHAGGGVAPRAPQPGVLSSSDAEARVQRELQVRVQLAP